MNLSFWERDTFFSNIDFAVVGSGIVGMSTAYHLRLKFPTAKIAIFEKGFLPSGASTKNAGFACFGSISEILMDLETESEENIYRLVEKRYNGLKTLRRLLGDQKIGYQQSGGFEVFRKEDQNLYERAIYNLPKINQWLSPIFGDDVYHEAENLFGFDNLRGLIKTPFEGQIHTGNMINTFLKLVQSKDIRIFNGGEITRFEEIDRGVNLELNRDLTFNVRNVLFCTNAFTREFLDLDVVPARGQVLVTRPIAGLKIKGNFHMDRGYYYFRNVGSRILFGGGRNLDYQQETTTDFGLTEKIQTRLETYLNSIILPHQPFEIEQRWSGIMAMGASHTPIIKQVSDHVYCAVRLSGMGVAIGTQVGKDLAALVN